MFSTARGMGPPGSDTEPWPDPEDASPDLDLPLCLGETLAERYVLESILGSGGMGVVCRARHVELEQPVAVKFLRKRFVQERSVVGRFLEEARAAAALRSEHVVRVMDVGQTESGVPYYVMEHLEGTDLESLLSREGPLRISRAVDYVKQACAALREAHALGIVHRDVKPENLFLAARGSERPVLKVVDFGIAKRLDPARRKVVTGPQENVGSPCYMSPEQMWTPRAVDTRTDIWSLGVVLYQLLTGALPFDGESVSDVFTRVASAQYAGPSTLRPDVDAHLEAIVQRCLEKSLDARYQTVDALVVDLERYEATVLMPTHPSMRVPQVTVRLPSDAPVSAPVSTRRPPRRAEGTLGGWLFVALSALSVGGFAAARKGDGPVARAASGILAAVRAGAEGLLVPAPLDVKDEPVARGEITYVVEPRGEVSREDDRVRAEPEHEAPAAAETPGPRLSERERKERAYRRYLSRHGWRPLKEVLDEMGE